MRPCAPHGFFPLARGIPALPPRACRAEADRALTARDRSAGSAFLGAGAGESRGAQLDVASCSQPAASAGTHAAGVAGEPEADANARRTSPPVAPVPAPLSLVPLAASGTDGSSPTPCVPVLTTAVPRRSPPRAARPRQLADRRAAAELTAAPTQAGSNMRRTPEDIRAKCASDVPFPETLPNGPWLSAESAKAELDAWCQNVAVCGGGWGTSWINSRQANSSRGVQRVLGCHLKTRHACKWQLTLEETTAGWVVYSLTDEHTHELTQSLAESNSYAGMRAIPPDYHDLVRVLAAAGQSAAAIFRVLESKASRDGVPVTFTRQDVYTFSGATTAEKVFDATGLLEKLNERHKVQGLPFHFESDEEGRLSRVFIVLAGGLESYAKCISFVDDVEVNETTVQYDLTVCCLALLCFVVH